MSNQKERTIYRVEKTRDYSVICNHGLQDESLSFGARGLLGYMLTLPDDWTFYDEELAKHTTDTLYATKKLVKELKSKGYIKRVSIRDPETNKIKKWETVVYERPSLAVEEEPKEPEVGIQPSGENVDFTPEVGFPPTGIPDDWDSTRLGNQQLLNTDIKQNTEEPTIPVGEQKDVPSQSSGLEKLPELQKPTALIFLQAGQKKQLSADDISCLKMLFKIHTPAAIQSNILKAFERLEKNGSVKVEFKGEEYLISKAEHLPIRYIWNSMKNWTSLKGTGGAKDGKKRTGKVSRGNPNRDTKDYRGEDGDLFA